MFWEHLKAQHPHKRSKRISSSLLLVEGKWRLETDETWSQITWGALGKARYVIPCEDNLPFHKVGAAVLRGRMALCIPLQTEESSDTGALDSPRTEVFRPWPRRSLLRRKAPAFSLCLHHLQSYIHADPTVCPSPLSNLKCNPQKGAIYLPFPPSFFLSPL